MNISSPKIDCLSHVVRLTETFFNQKQRLIFYMHIGTAVFFVVLMGASLLWSDPIQPGYTYFQEMSTFLVWGLWFPLVFLSVLFTGRSWCGLFCPMGAASQWVSKIGLKRQNPVWLRWEGTPIFCFIIVTILGQTMGVRDHAYSMTLLFIELFILALLVGFLFGRNKRSWCRHCCPIGLLLGVFSRLGAVSFSPLKQPLQSEGYSEKGVCPTYIDLKNKSESRHCITCFKCVQPTTGKGIVLEVRKPGQEIEEIGKRNANFSEVFFLFSATGLSLGGFLWLLLPQYQLFRQAIGTWLLEQGAYWVGRPGPIWLMAVFPQEREVFVWLDFLSISLFMSGLMVIFIVLLSLLTITSSHLFFKNTKSHFRLFLELGYQYAPIAMVSLIVGLGNDLFVHIAQSSFEIALFVKSGLFLIGLLWSLCLGWKISFPFEENSYIRIYKLLPTYLGTVIIAICWGLAIF